MEFSELILALVFGIIGGMLSGLLGVGGGIIFIPVFEWIFKQKGVEGEELVRLMLANSFLAILFSGITSSYKHRKMGTFYPKEIITIAIPAMIFGSSLSYVITALSWFKDIYFQVVFILVILVTLWRLFVSGKKEALPELPYSMTKYGLIGVATGLISAFSGLGGGVAMIPLLTLILRHDMKKAAGISIGVIPIMILPMLVVYATQTPSFQFEGAVGYLQFLIVLPVVIGIFIGSPIGVAIAKRIKSKQLKLIFAILLIIIGIKYIYQLTNDHF
ncbi:MAG: putative membrane protein YfcA [Bacteroidia bacterium]